MDQYVNTRPHIDGQVIKELENKGYANISLIGRGGFSDVVRMWDRKRNCFLACKISCACEMAEREAAMLKMLQSPVFPRYIESFEKNEKYYLVMEYICGSTLRELQNRRGRFTQRQAVRIAMELAQGLFYLHKRSEPIIFRDIKPDNVMLRQDGRVKLIDVGCAGLLQEGGSLAGSKGYSAPEQFCREESIGVESDVYALGKLLYYMLTGEEGRENLYYRGISWGLIQLVEQATQSDRQKRIPDMHVFLQQLELYREKKSIKSRWNDMKALLHGKEIAHYCYIQNVQKGMDNQ